MLETISELFQEAYKRNWITARDGNASIRWGDRDHFFITPSGIRKQTLQPEMFKKIRIINDEHDKLYYTVAEYTDISKNLKPSGEIPLHFGLQKKINTDIRVVLHMHPTYTVAAMYAGIQLDQLVHQFPELGRYTRVGPNVPEVPPISQTLADETIARLEVEEDGNMSYHILGIDRHGVVSIDTSPWRAFEHIERLEHICKIVLSSRGYK